MQVGARVGRVDLLDDEVLDVRVDVRGAPRDPGVVTEDHTRHARERDAGNVVRAGGRHGPAVQPVEVPDRRHRDAQVRVVREQRAAAGRHGRADDPVVGADPVVRGEAGRRVQSGRLEEALAEAGDRMPGGGLIGAEGGARCGVADGRRVAGGRRRPRRTRARRWLRARVAGAARPGQAGRGDDRSAVAVGGEELIRPGRVAQLPVGQVPEHLGVEVAAQVPRLDLAPRDRVEVRPRLRRDAGDEERQPERPAMRVQPRVDALGVRIEDGPGGRRDGVEVALGRDAPAEGPDELVRVELARPEHLGQPAGRDMPPDLHLPHPLAGVDVALGEEEVVWRVGGDVRDPGRVAGDRHRCPEPGRGDRPGRLRHRANGDPCEEAGRGDHRHQHDDEQQPEAALQDPHRSPSRS